jgi:hypothetical protein
MAKAEFLNFLNPTNPLPLKKEEVPLNKEPIVNI